MKQKIIEAVNSLGIIGLQIADMSEGLSAGLFMQRALGPDALLATPMQTQKSMQITAVGCVG